MHGVVWPCMSHGTEMNIVIWKSFILHTNATEAERGPSNMCTEKSTELYRTGAFHMSGVNCNLVMSTIFIIHTRREQSMSFSLEQRY